jgi:hypothetical protein
MVSKKTTKKRLPKNARAAKKRTVARAELKMPPPSAQFISDLTAVFKRHGWSGLPQELSFSLAVGSDRTCADGSVPQPKWIDCPDGRRKMVYVCPGDDPTCDG